MNLNILWYRNICFHGWFVYINLSQFALENNKTNLFALTKGIYDKWHILER